MRRRELLCLVTGTASATLAGCVGGDGDDEPDDEPDDGTNVAGSIDEADPDPGSGQLSIGEESWSFTVAECTDGDDDGTFEIRGRTEEGYQVSVSRSTHPFDRDELVDAVSLWDSENDERTTQWEAVGSGDELFLSFEAGVVRGNRDFRNVRGESDERVDGSLVAACEGG